MILAGKDVASAMKRQAKTVIESNLQRLGRAPKLAIIMVGEDNAASQAYVRNKLKACDETGIINETIILPQNCTQADILSKIKQLNQDKTTDGILVQLPLPAHINVAEVQEAIRPDKDVDGFGKEHMGACWLNVPGIRPCTPAGIMALLHYYDIPLAGKNCLIIGRSNIVAKPLAAMLLSEDATVTIAHSKTKNLFTLSQTMDLIVVSVGKPEFLPPTAVKDGVILIDVGINRNEQGKLVGDVNHSCYDKATAYTPVPGGVGLLTVAQLICNCVQAWLTH